MENGIFDYSITTKSERSNSCIGNYNRRIKLKLSKFLFGKNKCEISWLLFIYFITNEEDEIKKEIFNLDNSIELKEVKINNKLNDIKNNSNIIEKGKNNINQKKENKEILELIKANIDNQFHRNWLNFIVYSYSHDIFFLLYTFVIYNKLKTEKK